ncbi:MAG TPA: NfeD family protein [Candidatus Acidoferrales bacterium]
MLEWFRELSAFAVFLSIAGVGFLFLLISLIFGELFEHFDHDHDMDLGHGGPSFFSTRVLSVFVVAFGCAGAVATHYGMSVAPASGVGVGSGFVFGWIVYAFARFLYGQQASSETRSADLVGQSARVTVAIPAGGVGQVRCRIGEELVDKIARTEDGSPVPENSVVRIKEFVGETVIVTRE